MVTKIVGQMVFWDKDEQTYDSWKKLALVYNKMD